jgi:hypothetical protein
MKEQIKVSNTFSFSRKLMKQDARNNLKRHYLFFVVVCLVSLLVQAEFVTTDYVIKLRSQFISDVVEAAQGTFAEETVTQVGEKVNEAGDDYDTFYQAFGDALEDMTTSNGYASDVFGRSKGMINSVINYMASDTFFSHAYHDIQHRRFRQPCRDDTDRRHGLVLCVVLVLRKESVHRHLPKDNTGGQGL